jgi:ribose/xylose/arabinose/galactoside ABC-type transport system permease subunit
MEENVTENPTESSQKPSPGTKNTFLSRVGKVISQSGPLIALILIGIYLSFATPFFLTTSNLVNVVRQSSITAILAIGQTLVILTAGIDISVGAITALAGSVAAVLMTSQINILGLTIGPVNVWVGILVAVIVGMLAGFINGVIITKGRIPDFIGTLGTLAIFRGIALLVTDGLPVPSHLTATAVSGQIPPFLIWLGSGDILGVPAAGIVAVLVTLVGYLVLRYTSLGRFIYAVGGNREAARVSGINVDRVRIAVYVASGLACAVAAMVLVGRLNSANALMAEGEELRSIGATVIGGTGLSGGEGGVVGSLIGALIMGVLGNGLNLLNVSAFWQRILQGLVVILVVLFDQWRRRRFSS